MSVESRLTDVEEALRLLRDADRLQGRPLSAKAPTDKDALGWNDTTKKWEPQKILDSGTYTPTLTNGTNVAASTAYESQFIRVGAIVCVSGKVDVDPTSGTTTTILGVSLPFASNLGGQEDVAGTCGQHLVTSASAGSVRADTTNNRADLLMHPLSDVNAAWSFIFQYQII